MNGDMHKQTILFLGVKRIAFPLFPRGKKGHSSYATYIVLCQMLSREITRLCIII